MQRILLLPISKGYWQNKMQENLHVLISLLGETREKIRIATYLMKIFLYFFQAPVWTFRAIYEKFKTK